MKNKPFLEKNVAIISKIKEKIKITIFVIKPETSDILLLRPIIIKPIVQPASNVPKLPKPFIGRDSVINDRVEAIINKLKDIFIPKLMKTT